LVLVQTLWLALDALGLATSLAAGRPREAGIVLEPLLRKADLSVSQINNKGHAHRGCEPENFGLGSLVLSVGRHRSSGHFSGGLSEFQAPWRGGISQCHAAKRISLHL